MKDFYTLKNKNGMTVQICVYGATVSRVLVKNSEGKEFDVVLGFDKISDYEDNQSNIGATVGRHAGRIKDARFVLNGVEYKLEKNDGPNSLHSGTKVRFATVRWTVLNVNDSSIALKYISKDMEQGIPGNLDTTVTYTLNDDNALDIDIKAVSDKDTIINMTNHSYFNLSGDSRRDIFDHRLTLYASNILSSDDGYVIDGKTIPVKGTAFDFTSPKLIGEDVKEIDAGYNHNYVLDTEGDASVKAAHLECDYSGIYMDMYTNQKCVQLYSSYYLDEKSGKGNIPLTSSVGICLEAQNHTDANNHKGFNEAVLRKGELYQNHIVYQFGCM